MLKDQIKLNTHTALWNIANLIFMGFGCSFFVELGFSGAEAVMIWGCYLLLRAPLRLLAFPLMAQLSPVRCMLLGAATIACAHFLMGYAHAGLGYLIGGMSAIALGEALYWTNYHPLFAETGSNDARGKQVAVMYTFMYSSLLLAPVLTGYLASFFGLRAGVYLASGAAVLAMLPLFFILHPRKRIEKPYHLLGTTWMQEGWKSYVTYLLWSIPQTCFFILLPLIAFLTLKEDPIPFGWLLTALVFLRLVLSFGAGHLFDLGMGRKMYTAITVIYGCILGMAAFLTFTPSVVTLYIAVATVAESLFGILGDSMYYAWLKGRASPFATHFYGELGWDSGVVLLFLGGGSLVQFGLLPDISTLFIAGALGSFAMGAFATRAFVWEREPRTPLTAA